jgi:glucosamine--fructose-6-phosphate aminotransferase (isomerizing)
LVSPEAPLVILATSDPNDPDSVLRYEKTLHLMRDMHKQGARIVCICSEDDEAALHLSTYAVAVPRVDEFLLPMLEVVPLQMLAYFMAVQRGINVDAPRNLVKAVVRE